MQLVIGRHGRLPAPPSSRAGWQPVAVVVPSDARPLECRRRPVRCHRSPTSVPGRRLLGFDGSPSATTKLTSELLGRHTTHRLLLGGMPPRRPGDWITSVGLCVQ